MSDQPLWVFGYGSLMWDPGFPVAERQVARLDGYHRSFCMWSIHYRGTKDAPGLVLALDAAPGGSCLGLGFRVTPGAEDETLAILRARELVSYAYYEARVPITLVGGEQVQATTYVVDPKHDQYCGQLTLEEQAAIIARAHGERGPNTEYLHNTVDHLSQLGIDDPDLAWLNARVRRMVP
ncbi:gamma-glutamylcyclotransferase [Actibacterium ureilyticum]|uniref:gamma-glutamylcyclotransferase n=1 Tax=Actibacterium ureilyticum TaxID=1590614 RepID=UPI000BAAC675|nr:gamma-glutamylcyclotransferase [Actibacterium ureilyticum]